MSNLTIQFCGPHKDELADDLFCALLKRGFEDLLAERLQALDAKIGLIDGDQDNRLAVYGVVENSQKNTALVNIMLNHCSGGTDICK